MTEVYRHPCALKTLHYILNFPHKLLRLLESLNAEGLGGFFSGLGSGIRINGNPPTWSFNCQDLLFRGLPQDVCNDCIADGYLQSRCAELTH